MPQSSETMSWLYLVNGGLIIAGAIARGEPGRRRTPGEPAHGAEGARRCRPLLGALPPPSRCALPALLASRPMRREDTASCSMIATICWRTVASAVASAAMLSRAACSAASRRRCSTLTCSSASSARAAYALSTATRPSPPPRRSTVPVSRPTATAQARTRGRGGWQREPSLYTGQHEAARRQGARPRTRTSYRTLSHANADHRAINIVVAAAADDDGTVGGVVVGGVEMAARRRATSVAAAAAAQAATAAAVAALPQARTASGQGGA